MNAARLLVPLALLGLLSAAWLKGGWPALALAASGVVLWALLHCTRLLAVMRRAAARPLGYVDSAVMLNARLRPRLPLLHVVAMTGALGERVEPASQPQAEAWRWRDGGGSSVTAEFVHGRLTQWRLERPPVASG